MATKGLTSDAIWRMQVEELSCEAEERGINSKGLQKPELQTALIKAISLSSWYPAAACADSSSS